MRDKHGRYTGPHPDMNRFSKDNQPSAEKKSLGIQRHWEFRKARKNFFEALTDMKCPVSGKTQNFWEKMAEYVQEIIINGHPSIEEKDRLALAIKLADQFLPKEPVVAVAQTDQPIILQIDSDDAEL